VFSWPFGVLLKYPRREILDIDHRVRRSGVITKVGDRWIELLHTIEDALRREGHLVLSMVKKKVDWDEKEYFLVSMGARQKRRLLGMRGIGRDCES